MRLVALLGLFAALVVAAPAASAPRTPHARVLLGVLGEPNRFQQQTGQRSAVVHSFIGWHQPSTIPKLLGQLGPLPMIAIKTGGSVSPLDIAQGRGDAFLLALNAALAGFGQRVYVRPLPEMNGHWNEYSAFERDGSSRGARYSTAAFRKAFARIALIARGGSAGELNPKLRKLGGPAIGGDLPRTQARLVWNPQGYGAPDIPANAANAYYPGDAYVDVVANDLYDQGFKAAWDANDALYASHPRKPFAIGEWGLWGIDDPAYVERMATFVRSHAAGRAPRLLLEQAGLDLGPREQAAKPRRLSTSDLTARSLTGVPTGVRDERAESDAREHRGDAQRVRGLLRDEAPELERREPERPADDSEHPADEGTHEDPLPVLPYGPPQPLCGGEWPKPEHASVAHASPLSLRREAST